MEGAGRGRERRRPSPHLPGDQAQGLFLSQGLPDRWDTEGSGCSHPTPSLLGLGGLPSGDAAACVWVPRACGGPTPHPRLSPEARGGRCWSAPVAFSPGLCVAPKGGGAGSWQLPSPSPATKPRRAMGAVCPSCPPWRWPSRHSQLGRFLPAPPSASRVTLLKARGPDGLPANFCDSRFPIYDMGSCPLKGVSLEGLSWGMEGTALRKQKQGQGQRW